MARHRRHRRRHYGDYVKIPGLSGIMDAFKGSVPFPSLGLGILLGFGGTVGVTWAISKWSASKGSVSMTLYKAIPLLGGLGAGLAAYMIRRKKNKQQANALLLGSLVGGLVPVGWSLVKQQFASLSFLNGLAAVNGVDGYVVQPALSGVIVNNPNPALQGYNGVIVDNPNNSAFQHGFQGYGDPGESMNADDAAELLAP